MSMDMDKLKATPTRAGAESEAASPTTPAYFSATGSRSRSRQRPAGARAAPFSASRSRLRSAFPSLRPDVDYSKHDLKKMKKLRLVPEEEWFPHQRHEHHLTGGQFWTVVQKDLSLALKKPASDMRWIDWASVHQSTGTDVRRYFAATPGLDRLLEKRDLRWADSYIRQFYATLWIHPDRSRIRFMFGNEQRELSKDDFAKYLGLSDSGARVYSLAYPNGNKDEVHLPSLESIRHLYNNPDAVMELWKDTNQLNHETAVVHAVVRISIRPRSGDALTTLEIWILHLLMSEKPIDVIDLMIGEMQEVILDIRRRLLPYAPYLIFLFYTKGWLKNGMRNELNLDLKLYKAPKRRQNSALPLVKSCKTRKPGGRRVASLSFPPQVEAVFHDDEPAHLDCVLSPSLEECAHVVTTNEEDDPHMVPAPPEFRFSQPGAHDADAGGSGWHADVPPMLQSQVDRQTAILEQIQGQHERDRQQILGQLAELQRQSGSDLQKILGQLIELQRQHELDRQQLQEQHELDRQQLQGQLAELQRQHELDRQQLQEQLADLQRQHELDRQQLQEQHKLDRQQLQGHLAELQQQHDLDRQQLQEQHELDRQQLQGHLAELQQQHEHDRQQIQVQHEHNRQDNQDLQNLAVVSLCHTLCKSSHDSDVLAVLDKSLSAFCGL